MDYAQLEYYSKLFNDCYDYIKDNASFDVTVTKKSLPSKVEFPTVLIREAMNINQLKGTATNHQESVDLLTYQVDIITKDIIDDYGVKPSLEVQKELKNLIFNFFYFRGFSRISTEYWENTNIEYDRLTLLFQGNLQSWNKQIR